MAACAAVVIGAGYPGWGVVLLAAAGIPDLLDGAVAKVSGRASKRGAFFDSVADRVTDALLLGGVAWYLVERDGGQAAMLPYAVLAASLLISYQRAKAESLGYSAKGGLMERAERTIALGIGLAFADRLLVPVLWIMLVLTLITAVQRFVKVWRQAEAPLPLPARSLRTSRSFREWRETAAVARSERRTARRDRPTTLALYRSRRAREGAVVRQPLWRQRIEARRHSPEPPRVTRSRAQTEWRSKWIERRDNQRSK
jgi:CDP-diacylglycerol--glycerol-3-phosphate 3-phosphatidyltransferase